MAVGKASASAKATADKTTDRSVKHPSSLVKHGQGFLAKKNKK
jgi:hypothetical protein